MTSQKLNAAAYPLGPLGNSNTNGASSSSSEVEASLYLVLLSDALRLAEVDVPFVLDGVSTSICIGPLRMETAGAAFAPLLLVPFILATMHQALAMSSDITPTELEVLDIDL